MKDPAPQDRSRVDDEALRRWSEQVVAAAARAEKARHPSMARRVVGIGRHGLAAYRREARRIGPIRGAKLLIRVALRRLRSR